MTPAALRDQINDSFSEDELRLLCFDLAVDYENLAGTAKLSKAQSLVRLCLQQNRVNELLDACRVYRPALNWTWSGIVTVAGPARNLEEMFAQATRLSLMARSAGELREALMILQDIKEIDPLYPGVSAQIARTRRALTWEEAPLPPTARPTAPSAWGGRASRAWLWIVAVIVLAVILVLLYLYWSGGL